MKHTVKSAQVNAAAAGPKPQTFPAYQLRESLRLQAAERARMLSRSVGRQTSYDALPCPEYALEVGLEYQLVDALLYLQQARNALEHCLSRGSARLSYRWQDGRVTLTRFRRVRPGRVVVWGLCQAG